MIDGVRLRPLAANQDLRGSFTEIYSDCWGLPIEPRQWSLVRSAAGTLRGMHLHLRHDEYFLLLDGTAVIGLYDLRPDSSTSGQSQRIDLSAAEPLVVAFPRGIVHGWYFPTDATHLQAVSEPYSEYGADDNEGCHWADPELGISWPASPTRISARAERFGTLANLRERAAELRSMV